MNTSTPHQPIFREHLGIPYKSRRLISDPHHLEYLDHVELKIRTYVRPQSSAKVDESDGIDSGDRDYFIARSISLTVSKFPWFWPRFSRDGRDKSQGKSSSSWPFPFSLLEAPYTLSTWSKTMRNLGNGISCTFGTFPILVGVCGIRFRPRKPKVVGGRGAM